VLTTPQVTTTAAATAPTTTLWRCGGRMCPPGTCDHDEELHRHATGQAPEFAPQIVHDVLRGHGEPLPGGVRRHMEHRLGHNFSDVRIHRGPAAEASAHAVDALAYTVGHDVVFGGGTFQPDTISGRRLITHELSHVAAQPSAAGLAGTRLRVSSPDEAAERHATQISESSFTHPVAHANPVTQPNALLRQPAGGDAKVAAANAELIVKIRATAAYKALAKDDVTLTEEIITEIQKKPLANQFHFLSKLKALFDTPLKAKETIAKETQATTVAAAKQEQKRVATEAVQEKALPPAAKSTNIEEKASSDPARTWVKLKGKFGGGSYEVDRSSPTNIVVRAKVFLKKTGRGTQADVDAITAMEDGIEKAASTKGYVVDLKFVKAADADTFTVEVDPGRWEVATNWAGGNVTGYAHELHHLMTFELDRYDYTGHATNDKMIVHDRLYWFRQELKKPPNYNDPTSIMNSAAHPNHDDACRVAGLDLKTCIPARQKALP
jgi:uncharacterized protein DUF4157